MSKFYHNTNSPAFYDLGVKADKISQKMSFIFLASSIIFLAIAFTSQKFQVGTVPSLLYSIPGIVPEEDNENLFDINQPNTATAPSNEPAGTSINDTKLANILPNLSQDDFVRSPIRPIDKTSKKSNKNYEIAQDYNDNQDDTATQSPEAFSLRNNEKLELAFNRVGVSHNDSQNIIKSISAVYPVDSIRANTDIRLDFSPNANDGSVQSVNLKLNDSSELKVSRIENTTNFKTILRTIDYRSDTRLYKFRFLNNINQSASSVGLNEETIKELTKLFSYDIDFQRDFKNGDEFELLLTNRTDKETGYVAPPIIYSATIKTTNNNLTYIRYQHKDGKIAYYDMNGKSQRKGLLKTPVAGGQVSSGFADSRIHPVLNYSRAHRGIDFMAPIGTPVYAAGDGIVVKSERFAGYGNYIRIRHDNEFETAYAHLRGYAKNIRPGARVRQGEVIGFVGVTGLTTGPHLHYEVIRGGQQINPGLKLASTGNSISDNDMEIFKQKIQDYEELAKSVKLVSDN